MNTSKCPNCGADFFPKKIGKTSRYTMHCSIECAKAARVVHGHAPHSGSSRTYNTWNNMVGRCTRQYHAGYKRYGAIGITVCDRWLSFAEFLADMGERPEGCTIDRIDATLGYFKENCRWATIREQQSNIKSNVFIEFNGEIKHVSEWARGLGCDPSTISYRIKRGWELEKVLTIKPKLGNRIKRG